MVPESSTWSPAVNNHTTGELLTGATFRSDGVGFITGYLSDGTEGFVLFSDDGGATWDLNYSTAGLNSARRLYDVRFFDVAHGYAMGQIRALRSNGVITTVEEEDAAGFTLFPNPAHDVVTIEVGGPAEVRVLDAQGRVVRRVTTRDRAIVPLDGLGVGAYVAEVRRAGAVQRRTFLRH